MTVSNNLWLSIESRDFIADGTNLGVVRVANADDFRMRQQVYIKATSQPDLILEVKTITSTDTLTVGPLGGDIGLRSDLSLYTTAQDATIEAPQQPRSVISQQELIRISYQEGPTFAPRTILVDNLGRPVSEINPLPISGSFSAEVTPVQLFDKRYNKLTVTSKNDDGDPLEIHTFLNGVPVQIGTIIYDVDGDFQEMEVLDA